MQKASVVIYPIFMTLPNRAPWKVRTDYATLPKPSRNSFQSLASQERGDFDQRGFGGRRGQDSDLKTKRSPSPILCQPRRVAMTPQHTSPVLPQWVPVIVTVTATRGTQPAAKRKHVGPPNSSRGRNSRLSPAIAWPPALTVHPAPPLMFRSGAQTARAWTHKGSAAASGMGPS